MERIYPKKNNDGTIGKSGRAWSIGYFWQLIIRGVTYVWPSSQGAASTVLTNDGAGNLSWGAAGGATAFDDIGDPDAAGTIAMTTYKQTITSTKTDDDNIIISGQGNFGDVSVLRVESLTGNPTDGTVLEVVAHDANVDPLVVSASGQAAALVVAQNTGNVSMGGNLAVTGSISAGSWALNAISASTADQTITVDGNNTGGVNIGSTSTGGITLGAAVTVADGKDVTIGEGVLTIDNDQTNEAALVITSAGTTSGGAIDITAATTTGNVIMVTANDLGSGGAMLMLDTDNIASDNYYIECYDGTATDLTVGQYGNIAIAGNASTDIVTITAGDIQVTAGDIDLDNGIITVDVNTDQTNYFKRNQGVTTGPVVEIEETAAAADNPALLIDQNATAAASYGLEIASAGGTILHADIEAATGDGILFNVPASYTGQLIKVDDTLVGTTGEGCVLDARTTANLADGASLVRLDFDTGTMAGAHDGFMMSVDDDSVAVGTSYAVLIDSANNEALHIATGKALFDEQATFTAGLDVNAGIDCDMATNAALVNLTNAATDLAAGDAVLTVYGSGAAGQTNASYLARLAWKADGDAQDGFLLCQDNSTGAAGNGDQKLKIGTNGTITMGAGTTGTGGALMYSFENLTIANAGTAASLVQVVTFIATDGDSNEDNVTLADGTVGQLKIFISKTEGAGGDTWKITPANLNGGTKISFDGVVGDACTLIFDGTKWNVVSTNGGTIS